MKVFVYGTLMKGFGNHRVMEAAKGKFVSRAYIRDKDIYFVSYGSFPAVVDGDGIVFGEIYEISENDKVQHWGSEMVHPIRVLDGLEGYDPKRPVESNMYIRKRIVAVTPKGKKIWCSYYHWNGDVSPQLKIKSGDWGKAVKKVKSYW